LSVENSLIGVFLLSWGRHIAAAIERIEGIDTQPNDHHVYVANWFDNTVSVIDTKKLEVIQTIER